MSKSSKLSPAAKPAAKPAPAPVPAPVPAVVPPAIVVVVGQHGGVPLASLPANIAARGSGVGKATPAVLAIRVVLGAHTCKVRAAHCVQWWEATRRILTMVGTQGATVQELAAANVPPHFTIYAVRNGWLAEAKAEA